MTKKLTREQRQAAAVAYAESEKRIAEYVAAAENEGVVLGTTPARKPKRTKPLGAILKRKPKPAEPDDPAVTQLPAELQASERAGRRRDRQITTQAYTESQQRKIEAQIDREAKIAEYWRKRGNPAPEIMSLAEKTILESGRYPFDPPGPPDVPEGTKAYRVDGGGGDFDQETVTRPAIEKARQERLERLKKLREETDPNDQ